MSIATAGKEEELHWLALKLIPGLGTRNSGKLLDRFRTPQAIFRASRSELEGAGLSGVVAQSIASGCTFEDAAVQQEKMMEAGAVLVTLGDPRYPRPLREIFDPPIALFARGRVELLETLSLGIVGTRRPTPYGLAAAERLSADLAHAGLTVASGMARGLRGGSWHYYEYYLRNIYRGYDDPAYSDNDLGFRCVIAASAQENTGR